MNSKRDKADHVVFFDLETQKLADEVGGWKYVSRMKMSIAVTYSTIHGFKTFTEEEDVDELVSFLTCSDMVVGFNHIKFDYEVLSAYTNENLRGHRNLDMLLEIQKTLGHRLSLDHLAEFTLGKRKSGSGLDAAKWFREGRLDLLEKYCRDDVVITRDLYQFGIEKGYLMYRRRDGVSSRIPVSWKNDSC